MGLPETEQLQMMFQSILALKNEEECRRYLEDLCTIKEAQDLAQRLDIARRLDRGDSYNETAQQTGASSATISRVNRCPEYGAQGYALILDRLPKLEPKEETK